MRNGPAHWELLVRSRLIVDIHISFVDNHFVYVHIYVLCTTYLQYMYMYWSYNIIFHVHIYRKHIYWRQIELRQFAKPILLLCNCLAINVFLYTVTTGLSMITIMNYWYRYSLVLKKIYIFFLSLFTTLACTLRLYT